MIERAVHLPPRADGSPRSLRALATALALASELGQDLAELLRAGVGLVLNRSGRPWNVLFHCNINALGNRTIRPFRACLPHGAGGRRVEAGGCTVSQRAS